MATDTRAWARVIFEGSRIEGNDSYHLNDSLLAESLKRVEIDFVKRWGLLESIVLRCADGTREQPVQAQITVEDGLIGDRWVTGKAKPGDQLSMMNLDVAAAIANGQSIVLFGDNLFTRLDIREEALPTGSRLRIGEALVEVSSTPHVPCNRFRSRFGSAAFEHVRKNPRLRGVYLTVIEGGGVALGDAILHA